MMFELPITDVDLQDLLVAVETQIDEYGYKGDERAKRMGTLYKHLAHWFNLLNTDPQLQLDEDRYIY